MIKLLWVGDCNPSTGFGQILDNIAPRLLATGEFELVVLGVNYHGARHPYEGVHVYSTDSSDPYGFGAFPGVVETERPDVIFILQDVFACSPYIQFLKDRCPDVPLVLYFPIDGNSVPPSWRDCIRFATVPMAYSWYGHKMICDLMPEMKDKLRMTYHGIDHTNFYPDPVAREEAKRANNLVGRFVLGVVNRFQPRKLIPIALRIFALMYHGYKKCQCGNYYLTSLDRCDLNNCGPEDIVGTVDPKKDMVIYLHMNLFERLMGGEHATVQMAAEAVGITEADKCMLNPGVDLYGPHSPDKIAMNKMYNMLDCYMATDLGEGYGLTQVEALSCGLPIVKSQNTTAKELVGKFAYLAPSAGFCTMGYDSGHYRPIPNIPSMVEGVEAVYSRWKRDGKIDLSFEQHDYVVQNFNWDEKFPNFVKAIKDAIEIKQNAQASPGAKVVEV